VKEGPEVFLVIIRTYRRPVTLERLVGDLLDAKRRGVELRVWVFDDGTPVDERDGYEASMRQVRGHSGGRWLWCTRRGKKRAWELYNQIFELVRLYRREMRKSPVHSDRLRFVFLDDDMRLCRDFFPRMLRVWDTLPRKERTTLQLMLDDGRGPGPCWTGYEPKEAGKLARRVQWVDGPFLCECRFFDRLNHRLKPIPWHRWSQKPELSTGVGQQVSHRLHALHCGLYQVRQSLVVHSHVPSLLNPEAREQHRLEAVDFIDGDEAGRELAMGG